MNMTNSAIHHLSKKIYSEGELRDILEAQYCNLPDLNKALNETLNYLERHQLLHDGRLAQDIARHYSHKGNQFIRNLLKQRKIHSKQIDSALMAIPDEYTRAWEEAKKKLNSDLERTSFADEELNTLSRFLSGRQFNCLIIRYIIKQLNVTAIYKAQTKGNCNWKIAS